MTALLKIEGVTVRFGGLTAVAGAGFELEDNRLLGFIGPNGAGKTTLLRVITGVVKPDAGRLSFRGRDITGWPTHERVRFGLALGQQIVRPLRGLTLLDNVALAAGHRRLLSPLRSFLQHSRAEERSRALALLERVGLAEVAGRLPDEVPLGFLKRLEVARALALEPKLLLLDEPLAGLSRAEATAMADLIAGLTAPGLSVVLIEHNLGEVMRICPLVYVQDNGRPLAFGPTAEVMRRKDVLSAYLGVAG